MIQKRTFIDSGVLIAAARGKNAPSISALKILDDQSREFASSPFVELEVLPKAVYNRKRMKLNFMRPFLILSAFGRMIWQGLLGKRTR